MGCPTVGAGAIRFGDGGYLAGEVSGAKGSSMEGQSRQGACSEVVGAAFKGTLAEYSRNYF